MHACPSPSEMIRHLTVPSGPFRTAKNLPAWPARFLDAQNRQAKLGDSPSHLVPESRPPDVVVTGRHRPKKLVLHFLSKILSLPTEPVGHSIGQLQKTDFYWEFPPLRSVTGAGIVQDLLGSHSRSVKHLKVVPIETTNIKQAIVIRLWR
jgi:hypothetical protein